MKSYQLVITCEHAVNTIPPEYQSVFAHQEALLHSHRGIDIGALGIATNIIRHLHVPFFQAHVSRLLIDNNRSLSHPHCFSEFTKPLSESCKQKIIQKYYQPYRQPIIEFMASHIQNKQAILHLSIHSFTPIMNGHLRKVDIGLLYDARRRIELNLAQNWQTWLQQQDPDLIIRRNYPYMGKTDGLVSHLRTVFPEQLYVGFEIESNQAKVVDVGYQEKFGKLFAQMVAPYLTR